LFFLINVAQLFKLHANLHQSLQADLFTERHNKSEKRLLKYLELLRSVKLKSNLLKNIHHYPAAASDIMISCRVAA